MFVGRVSEMAELEQRWQRGQFEFGVVYGTRRIGKTKSSGFTRSR